MFTFLPNAPVFYMDTCQTGCFFETEHRLDSFVYNKKGHRITFRICCLECEQMARESQQTYSVTYVTFYKKDWINFVATLGLVEPEN